jgi:beta-lactamase class A
MRAFALLLTLTTPLGTQTPLHQQIAEIAKDAKGTVYVACWLPGTKLDCDLNEHGHPPMQSTFKFPLAMAVLNQIELGKLQLDQPIPLLKSDRSVTYSPLQDEFPQADVEGWSHRRWVEASSSRELDLVAAPG